MHWINNSGASNEVIKRKQYPLPIIQDVLKIRPRCDFFTKVDLSMQYCTFELDEETKEVCTIITPYGKDISTITYLWV
ncbi:hypothetical protein ACHAWF_000222 [Thalassiosira exigua]